MPLFGPTLRTLLARLLATGLRSLVPLDDALNMVTHAHTAAEIRKELAQEMTAAKARMRILQVFAQRNIAQAIPPFTPEGAAQLLNLTLASVGRGTLGGSAQGPLPVLPPTGNETEAPDDPHVMPGTARRSSRAQGA